MQCRTHGIGRGMSRTGNQSVGFTALHHHHTKIVDVLNGLTCLIKRYSSAFTQLIKRSRITFEFIGSLRIDNRHTFADTSSDFGIAQNDNLGNTLFGNHIGGSRNALIKPFGQYNRPLVCLCFINHRLNKFTATHL